MVLVLCALLALAYVLVIGALLVGWGGAFSQLQRAGLALSASGMVGAGLPRLNGDAPGLWDLLFLAGLMTFLGRTYGPAIFRNLDGLDGVFDQKIRLRSPRHDAQ